MDFIFIFYRLDLSNNELSRIPTNSLTNAAAASLVELDLSGNYIPAVSIADFAQRFRVIKNFSVFCMISAFIWYFKLTKFAVVLELLTV